jgi:hypothetical protein
MRKSIVAAATMAAVLSIGTPTRNATAMPVVTPGQLAIAGGIADSVEKTVLICGPGAAIGAPAIGDGTGPMRIRTPIGVGAAIIGGAGIGTVGGAGIGTIGGVGTAIGAAGERPIVGSHAPVP